jgi:hypothetical protein
MTYTVTYASTRHVLASVGHRQVLRYMSLYILYTLCKLMQQNAQI